MKPNDITHAVIGAAIDVHRAIGPGQDEVLYEDALEVALRGRGIRFQRQKSLPVHYRGVKLDCGFRPDFVVEETIVAEGKAVELTRLPLFGVDEGVSCWQSTQPSKRSALQTLIGPVFPPR